MKPIGFGRRRLGVLALPALGLPALAACGSSPEPGLYTLAVRQGSSLSKGPRVVQLRDIGLPGYLDRKEIVRSSEDYKLDVRANAWWGTNQTLSIAASQSAALGGAAWQELTLSYVTFRWSLD